MSGADIAVVGLNYEVEALSADRIRLTVITTVKNVGNEPLPPLGENEGVYVHHYWDGVWMGQSDFYNGGLAVGEEHVFTFVHEMDVTPGDHALKVKAVTAGYEEADVPYLENNQMSTTARVGADIALIHFDPVVTYLGEGQARLEVTAVVKNVGNMDLPPGNETEGIYVYIYVDGDYVGTTDTYSGGLVINGTHTFTFTKDLDLGTGEHAIRGTAYVSGYQEADYLDLTNNTQTVTKYLGADIVMSDFTYIVSPLDSGETHLELKAVISNAGNAPLPKNTEGGIRVQFYLDSEFLGETSLFQEEMAVGENQTFSYSTDISLSAGSHMLEATAVVDGYVEGDPTGSSNNTMERPLFQTDVANFGIDAIREMDPGHSQFLISQGIDTVLKLFFTDPISLNQTTGIPLEDLWIYRERAWALLTTVFEDPVFDAIRDLPVQDMLMKSDLDLMNTFGFDNAAISALKRRLGTIASCLSPDFLQNVNMSTFFPL